MAPQPTHDFEPGYSPVVVLTPSGPSATWGRAAVGERPGRVRVELDGDRSFEFDPEGRLVVAQLGGESWRPTLDLRLVGTEVIEPAPGAARAPRRLRALAPVEAPRRRLAEWYSLLRSVHTATESAASVEVLRGTANPPLAWARQRLRAAAAWDAERLETEHRAVLDLYQPIPVLPPDQYRSLVLQATEGCPWDRCSFCTFYRGVRHRIRTPEEFLAHVDAVIEHLGRSVERYQRVFLGQANALLAHTEVLERMLEGLAARLPLLPADLHPARREAWRRDHPRGIEGVYGFVDGFHRARSVEEWTRLAALGVRRVYLGLESGSEEVLRILGKPMDVGKLPAMVGNLRAAGIATGIIVLVGAGGAESAIEHERRTLELLAWMGLGQRDQVYLSELVEQEGAAYAAIAAESGMGPLDARQRAEQRSRLRAGLRRVLPANVPVADYDIVRLGALSPRA